MRICVPPNETDTGTWTCMSISFGFRRLVEEEAGAEGEEDDDEVEGDDAEGKFQQQVGEALPGDRVGQVPAQSKAIPLTISTRI